MTNPCRNWPRHIYRTFKPAAFRLLIFRRLLQTGAVLMSLIMATAVMGVEPTDGYFYGVELEPVGSASITTVQTEPAVALVFDTAGKTAIATQQFDEWFTSSSRPDVTVFAIAVDAGDTSHDVLLEAVNQRNLHMPVFLARSDMLLGEDFRVMVLNDDQEVARFSTLDLDGVNKALSDLGVAIPEPVASPTPLPATPTPTSTNQQIPATGEPKIVGGPHGDPQYINKLFGMSVMFPPRWRYQIATRNDGAVAMKPPGSKIDMRVWAEDPDGIDSAQRYVDKTLEAMAKKYRTRIKVERRVFVRDEGVQGLDVTYTYTRPIDPNYPARGALMYRGRIKVYLDGDTIKAAQANAPSGEFMAMFPLLNSFFLSFQIVPRDFTAAPAYSPNTI